MKHTLTRNSFIINLLRRISDGLYGLMSRSKVGARMKNFEATKPKDGIVVSKAKNIFGKVNILSVKQYFASCCENSKIISLVRSLIQNLISVSVHSYGVFFLAFSIYSLLVIGAAMYAGLEKASQLQSYFWIDIGILICSLPMLFSKKPLYESLAKSKIINLIFIDFFGLRKNTLIEYGKKGKGTGRAAFIIGTLFGLLTYFVSPVFLLASIGVITAGYLVLVAPECGVLAVAFLIPFVSDALLGYFLIYISVCYFFKLLVGKRSISFNLRDCAVILIAVELIFGGIFSILPSLSFTYSVKLAFYVFSYILCVNLLKIEKWVKRLGYALGFSCIAVSIFTIAENIIDHTNIFLIEKSVKLVQTPVFFSSNQILGQYLSLTVFVVFAIWLSNERAIRKLFLGIMTIAVVVTLVLTASPWEVFAVLISLIVFMFIYSKGTIFVVLAAIPASFIVYALKPAGITQYVTTTFVSAKDWIVSHLGVWRSSISMARDYFFSGSGVGTYSAVFPSYANESVTSAANASNIYLQLIIDIGVFGLLLFMMLMYFFFKKNFSIISNEGTGVKSLACAAGICGVMATLLIGVFEYTWIDERLFLCMWMIMGYANASGKVLRPVIPANDDNEDSEVQKDDEYEY